MNPQLRLLLIAIGSVAVGGAFFTVNVRAHRVNETSVRNDTDSMQRVVLVCQEKVSGAYKGNLPVSRGPLRNRQQYVSVARVAVCVNGDGGACFNASTGAVLAGVAGGSIIVPSLREDLSRMVDPSTCQVLSCAQVNVSADAGTFDNPHPRAFCDRTDAVAVQVPDCVIPNGWRADGGWCEESCGVVDCRRNGQWRGFNVMPLGHASGSACVPVSCGVLAGDSTETL